MSRLAALRHRLVTLLRGAQAQDDLEEEMQLHIALRRERMEAQGLTSQAAHSAAARRFGNALRLREASVDAWGWRWLEQFAQDMRFACRSLVKAPGFTLIIMLTLALASGGTTAIFSIVNGVLLRPLPFADADRLVQIHGRVWREDREEPDPVNGPVGAFELTEFESQTTMFDGFTAYDLSTRHLDGPAGPERLTAISADRDFFSTLGVRPQAGRTFEPDDPLDVVVLSGPLWDRRFSRDPAIVGRSITLDGRPFTVIGVMPDAFQFPYSAASLLDAALPESRTDIWVPTQIPVNVPRGLARRERVTARLKPGVSLEAASAELRVIAARVEADFYRGTRARVGVRVVPLASEVIEPIRQSLWTLFAAVGLVLVAACANVANLLLARMTVRSGEILTRAALGAGRSRMLRQFVAEGLLLSSMGGLLGLIVAYWGTDLLVRLGSAKIPRAHEISFDGQAFVFLAIICLTTAVLFSLAPAYQSLRLNLRLAQDGGHAIMGRPYARVRDALVITEVALAFVLTLGAALVMREVLRLQNVPSGVLTANILTLHLTPRADAQDYYAIEQRVAQLPGVVSAGFTQLVPLQNWGWEAEFSIRGRATEERSVAGLRYVTPGYFRTLGIPVLQGRSFSLADEGGAPRVIVINEALARRYFAGENPVGHDLNRGTIVGVVGDVRQAALNRPAEPEIFYPAAQNVTMASDIGMSLIVRTDGPPEPLVDLIRAAVRDVNPRLAIFNVKQMEQVLADSLWELNLYRWLIGMFAGLVLTLAAIGLYGVMSYNVTARVREFALRLALGSDEARLARLILWRGIRLAVIGLAIGVVVSMQLIVVRGALPIESRPDPLVVAVTAILLLAIAVAACALPALRVARVNPVVAFRQD
jgi:putative ABC transport system permease protein